MALADTKLGVEKCPTCSKNKFTVYADGHGICGECKYRSEPTTKDTEADTGRNLERVQHPKDKRLIQPDHRSFERLQNARLEKDTLIKMGYFTGAFSGQRLQVAPLHNEQGTVVAQQITKPDGSRFILKGSTPYEDDKLWLFGRACFGDRYDRRVVVCQSPKDAAATAQAMGFKCAVTGCVRELAECEKDLKANYRWLERFQEIVLLFDSTPEGLQKAQECAQIFPVGRVRLAHLPSHTGPAEALRDNRAGDIHSAVWSASTYRPLGIVNANEGKEDFVEEAGLLPMWPYPFPNLQARTLGMRKSECTFHVAGTGASKTTILYQYGAHLATLPVDPPKPRKGEPPQLPRPKIGWIGFEDTLRSVKLGLLTAHCNQRLAIYPLPKEEIAKVYDSLFGSGAFELYDPETAEYTWAAIRGYVLYMAKALGCEVLIVDPLSFLVAMMGMKDERQALDQISAEFAALAKQTGMHIHVSHHLNRPDGTPHEEGARITLNHIKGSGGLAHFASNVFAYERNQQGERPDLMRIRSLKIRITGFTGASHEGYHDHQIVKYDDHAGTYSHTDEDWPPEEDDKGSKSSGSKAPGGGFSQDY